MIATAAELDQAERECKLARTRATTAYDYTCIAESELAIAAGRLALANARLRALRGSRP